MSRSAAPVTKSHPPTSPNTAPATQNECHQWSASHMQRHFQCAEQQEPPSNFTKYCTYHRKSMSSMICVTYATSFPMRGASKVTLQPHQILHLPRETYETYQSCYLTKLLVDWTGSFLKCYFTELWLLNCDSTELLLYWTVTWLTVTLMNCYFTELLLYWTVTLLNERWLYWTVTLLNYDSTELLLYWTVTLLNCYFTEFWALLNYDSTELWLYWTVTLLNFEHFLKVRNSEVSHPNFLWLYCYYLYAWFWWTSIHACLQNPEIRNQRTDQSQKIQSLLSISAKNSKPKVFP